MKQLLILFSSIHLFIVSSVAQRMPPTEEVVLENGLKVVLIPYGQLKTTSVALYINCGKKNEVPGQQLFSDIAAQCIGFGSSAYSKMQLKDELFKMGTTMSADVNENYTVVEASFTDNDLANGLKVMSSSAMYPLFPEMEIKQYINQILDYNNPMKMDILQQVSLFSGIWVYGNQNPVGRYYNAASLQKVTAADIKEFYEFNYTPKNSRLVLCGNFDKEKVKQMLNDNFGKWKAKYGEVNGVSFESPQMKNKEYGFIHRGSVEQAALQWNKNGPVPGSKDELPFLMANTVFNTVLFKEIREKGGKTYGINSRYNPYTGSSIYTIVTQVRNEEVLNTIKLFDATMSAFYNKEISATDLTVAKKSLRNNWQMIESPEDVISFFNPIIYNKSSLRRTYLSEIDAVTIEDVNRVIKKYYNPATYKLMISGDEQCLDKQLIELKPLRKFNIKDLEQQ